MTGIDNDFIITAINPASTNVVTNRVLRLNPDMPALAGWNFTTTLLDDCAPSYPAARMAFKAFPT